MKLSGMQIELEKNELEILGNKNLKNIKDNM
jgi:hypothetical protein